MKFLSELQATAQQLVENPKTTGVVATVTASLGMASFADVLKGAVGFAAVVAGLIATILLGRVHWINFENEKINNRMLRKQAADMGIDLSKDE